MKMTKKARRKMPKSISIFAKAEFELFGEDSLWCLGYGSHRWFLWSIGSGGL
jgi:hypothetical protein